jgi:hypothetical protein
MGKGTRENEKKERQRKRKEKKGKERELDREKKKKRRINESILDWLIYAPPTPVLRSSRGPVAVFFRAEPGVC